VAVARRLASFEAWQNHPVINQAAASMDGNVVGVTTS
jgi:hypothetical protein